jgi:hypothetical protein
MCYKRFGAYPNRIHITIIVKKNLLKKEKEKKERKNTTAKIRTNVSLRPEGPVPGQIDQGFPWFSLVPEQMLSWYPNSTLHCMLLIINFALH